MYDEETSRSYKPRNNNRIVKRLKRTLTPRNAGVFCLILGIFFLPILPPNGISTILLAVLNPPAQPAVVGAEVNVPFTAQHLGYTSTLPVDLVFTLSGGDLIVGQNLTLTVSLDAPADLITLYGHPIITVSLDDALAIPFTPKEKLIQTCPQMDVDCYLNSYAPSFDRLIFNTTGVSPWIKNQTIEYTVSGSFGATVDVFPNSYRVNLAALPIPSWELILHTPLLYTIAGEEAIASKRNVQLTATLTLFILGVTIIEVDRSGEGKKKHDDRRGNHHVQCFE